MHIFWSVSISSALSFVSFALARCPQSLEATLEVPEAGALMLDMNVSRNAFTSIELHQRV
jgi:hypothetical protein